MLKKILSALNRGNLIFLFLAIAALYQSLGSFIISVKPAKNFEDVMEEGVSVGDRIEGNIAFLLDYFAAEQSWTQNSNGSVTPKKTSAYYYIVPGTETYLAIEIRSDDMKAAEQLVEETYEYLDGGNSPSEELFFTGEVVDMEKAYPELAEVFYEELEDYYGFTEEEIKAMGTPLLIDYMYLPGVRGIFAAGVAFLVIAVLWIVMGVRKINKREREMEEARRAGEINIIER